MQPSIQSSGKTVVPAATDGHEIHVTARKARMPEAQARKPTVAVIGASRNPAKFGYRSVVAHLRHGYDVFPINPSAETIAGLTAYRSLADVPVEVIDRITVYVSPDVGIGLLDQFAAKHPTEVWFNPGSESPELLARAEHLGLPVVAACSLIDLERH